MKEMSFIILNIIKKYIRIYFFEFINNNWTLFFYINEINLYIIFFFIKINGGIIKSATNNRSLSRKSNIISFNCNLKRNSKLFIWS